MATAPPLSPHRYPRPRRLEYRHADGSDRRHGAGELLLSGGDVVHADLAVGVTGVWSKVRESPGPALSHEQTLECALRTMIPARAGDFGPAGAGSGGRGARRFPARSGRASITAGAGSRSTARSRTFRTTCVLA